MQNKHKRNPQIFKMKWKQILGSKQLLKLAFTQSFCQTQQTLTIYFSDYMGYGKQEMNLAGNSR